MAGGGVPWRADHSMGSERVRVTGEARGTSFVYQKLVPAKVVPRGESGLTNGLAKAERMAGLAAVERELARAMRHSAELTALARLQLLESMEAPEEHDELLAEITNDIERIKEKAQSSAGERKKYLYAGEQMKKRWVLFAALHNLPNDYTPAVEDMRKFAAFMYTQRQRRSVTGRPGLGDSIAEMAQYTLAQVSRTGSHTRASTHASTLASTRAKHAQSTLVSAELGDRWVRSAALRGGRVPSQSAADEWLGSVQGAGGC